MISSVLTLTAVLAAGGSESPRLIIDFFNAGRGLVHYEGSTSTSSLHVGYGFKGGARVVVGFSVENGPLSFEVGNNSIDHPIFVVGLDSGTEQLIGISDYEMLSLADGRYVLEAEDGVFESYWNSGESNGLTRIFCHTCMIVQSGDNFTISPSRGSTAELGFFFTEETIQTIGVIGSVTSPDFTVPSGGEEQEVTFPSGASSVSISADPSTGGSLLSALTINSGSSDNSGASCSSDVDGDGTIGFSDVLAILNDWGACP